MEKLIQIKKLPNFSLRVQPKLREKIISMANERGMSYNRFLTEFLEEKILGVKKIETNL